MNAERNDFRVAVVGATGLVGETMIKVLEERNFPVSELLSAREQPLPRQGASSSRARTIPSTISRRSTSARPTSGSSRPAREVSREYAPKAAAAGCIVIDNTSEFRYQDDIPLVVPEVNAHALAKYKPRGIIANPNCSTIQMLVALKPIHDAVGIERINVATYQSVSGAGTGSGGRARPAERRAHERARALVKPKVIPKQIAFNVVPQIDKFEANGYTKEEMKMVWETHKIMEDPTIRVNADGRARAGVLRPFRGGAHRDPEEDHRGRSAGAAEKAPGVTVLDERKPGGYPTAATEAANRDTVYVGRIREDISSDRGLNLWVVSDNVRKGAATNSVQIAEIMVRDYI